MRIIDPKVEVENYDGLKIMKNIERACRTCYRSEGLITDDSYKKLIKNCINRQHGSVMEHEKITVRLTCDVGCYKDLTRHRAGTAWSIESTRWCNYSKAKFSNEIKFIKPIFYKGETSVFEADSDALFQFLDKDKNMVTSNKEGYIQSDEDINKTYIWHNTMKTIENNYIEMANAGARPDELRMMLPHSTAAEVTMTANIREWRHILSLRCAKMTHPSIRQLLIPLLLKFKKDMPELFEDIEYDTDFPEDKYAEISIIED